MKEASSSNACRGPELVLTAQLAARPLVAGYGLGFRDMVLGFSVGGLLDIGALALGASEWRRNVLHSRQGERFALEVGIAFYCI